MGHSFVSIYFVFVSFSAACVVTAGTCAKCPDNPDVCMECTGVNMLPNADRDSCSKGHSMYFRVHCCYGIVQINVTSTKMFPINEY